MSNVILYMAISSDGFIADESDQTPWSDEEWRAFYEFVRSCDYAVIGKRTYEIMKKRNEFIEGPEYIVATTSKTLDTQGLKKVAIESRKDLPKEGRIGIIGGGEFNGRLAKLGLIDEMILDIENVKLVRGIRLFGTYDVPLKLELMESRVVGPETIQRHYKVHH
jgi:dihydrofolate reductase